MAIKLAGTTVINDSRVIGTSNGDETFFEDVFFTDFHPDVIPIPSSGAIPIGDADSGTASTQGYAAFTFAMTQNLQFSVAPAGAFSAGQIGSHFTIYLDRAAAGYTPTFISQFSFTSTPTWSSDRYWTISGVIWPDGVARCTAVPFDAVSAPSSSFSNFLDGLGNQWDNQANSWGTGTPWAAASISFLHDAANNRVSVTYGSGDSRNGSTQSTTYANYTGLTGISSVEVQYNPGTQSCTGSNCGSNSGQSYGPLPTDDGKAAGTYYSCASSQAFFGWSAEVDSSSGIDSHTYATFNSSDPDFRIKIVCNEGTFYSTANVGGLSLFCNYGESAGFNPGPGA